jgi:hypothetical protein
MLTQATVDNLDLGELQRTINLALAEVAADVHARPDVTKPRTISIKISVTPELNETPSGVQNYPDITYEVRTAKPAKASIGMKGFIGVDETTGEVQLMVNQYLPGAADDPRQQHIFDLAKGRESA